MCTENKACKKCSTKKPLTESTKHLVERSNIISKNNISVNNPTKRELVKQTRVAIDAIFSIYDIAEKQNLDSDQFNSLIDKSHKVLKELLAYLVLQTPPKKEQEIEQNKF